MDEMLKPIVRGVQVDEASRCAHYHSQLDIVAIKMACCETYYSCIDCHAALADHTAAVWPRSAWDTLAVLCGACGEELSIQQYMNSNSSCPHCASRFNPGCKNHDHFYFEMEEPA
jgi:uncharacterized CHY-type Zn-finger protein